MGSRSGMLEESQAFCGIGEPVSSPLDQSQGDITCRHPGISLRTRSGTNAPILSANIRKPVTGYPFPNFQPGKPVTGYSIPDFRRLEIRKRSILSPFLYSKSVKGYP